MVSRLTVKMLIERTMTIYGKTDLVMIIVIQLMMEMIVMMALSCTSGSSRT